MSTPAQLGGPSWTVLLGRRDATSASASLANSDLPGPNSNLNDLLAAFSKKGLSSTDMVALSGKMRCAACTQLIAMIHKLPGDMHALIDHMEESVTLLDCEACLATGIQPSAHVCMAS